MKKEQRADKKHRHCGKKHHGFGREWWADDKEELTGLLGKCGHFLYHRPERGRAQDRILKILENKEVKTQKEIQETLGIQPGSISEIISKLEARGMVTRDKDEQDKRKVLLKITEAGIESIKETSYEEKEKDLYKELSKEEQEILKGILRKLVDSWYKSE